MAIKIRMTRGGSKKRPFYRVVAADSRMPRDGRFIEKLGTYNPLLPKDDPSRVNLNVDKINDWLKKGAQVSDRISRMLENLSVLEPKKRNNPNKGKKHKATLERESSKSEKQKNAEEKKDIVEDIDTKKDKKDANVSEVGKNSTLADNEKVDAETFKDKAEITENENTEKQKEEIKELNEKSETIENTKNNIKEDKSSNDAEIDEKK